MSNKKIVKQIATERIEFLFRNAHQVFPEDKELSNRYISLAIRYAQRARINLPKEWKKRVCHKCKQLLYPGINCRIRMQSRNGKGSHVSMTCLECNNTTRYFIKIQK